MAFSLQAIPALKGNCWRNIRRPALFGNQGLFGAQRGYSAGSVQGWKRLFLLGDGDEEQLVAHLQQVVRCGCDGPVLAQDSRKDVSTGHSTSPTARPMTLES